MKKIFLSHPNKELQIHLNGVLAKALKRGFNCEILYFVCLFHDIAKTNSNFQKKLKGIFHGYSNHGYLSTYIAIYLLFNNKAIKAKFGDYIKGNNLFLNIVANIITKHHGNLKNIDEIFTTYGADGEKINIKDNEEIKRLIEFLNSNDEILFDEFLNENYPDFKDDMFKFEREYKHVIFEKLVYNDNYKKEWAKNPLKHYYDTLFNFGLLIEADKRDASNNNEYVLDNINYSNFVLDNNLNKLLNNLSNDSELDKKRTEIRIESVDKLKHQLDNTNNRLFELTSPTGSGKTFNMMKLANIIQQKKGSYSIIMALPFTAIIDQISDICDKNLLLDVLNYTSVSRTSNKIENIINIENKTDDDIEKLITYNFSDETFDASFIITTFVQFFQTLIGNRNSVLIKLPNFSKRIFLIDEFQSIPSSQYCYFYGLLQYFCETYDCYCILSTATMPNFELNDRLTPGGLNVKDVFKNYKKPIPLLNPDKYYNSDVFNRYTIKNIGDKTIDELIEDVNKKTVDNSVMVVMNTISDSIELFNYINHDNKFLLNSNFTSVDKLNIINQVKQSLKENKKTLLISTQVIEAGVDIDFPIVFRDICPLPSLIQTSGRCNRNGKLDMGYVYMFSYFTMSGESLLLRASLIYREKFDLNFVKENIDIKTEKELFVLQSKYYEIVSKYKTVGWVNENLNLVDALSEGNFEVLGRYNLINNNENEFQYYVGPDELWVEFRKYYDECDSYKEKDYTEFKKRNINLKAIQKKILKYQVNVRLNENKGETIPYSDEIMGIRNLVDKRMYSPVTGFTLQTFSR
jgi:CRISPR-associated endonuclease/helicase Cas3